MKQSLIRKIFVNGAVAAVMLLNLSVARATQYDWGDWSFNNATLLNYSSDYGYGTLTLTLTCSDSDATVGVPVTPHIPYFKALFPENPIVPGGTAYSPIVAGQTFQVDIDLTAYHVSPHTLFGFSNVATTNASAHTNLTYQIQATDKAKTSTLADWQFYGYDVNGDRPTETAVLQQTDLSVTSGVMQFEPVEVGDDSQGHFWSIGTNTAHITFAAYTNSPGGDGMYFYIGSPMPTINPWNPQYHDLNKELGWGVTWTTNYPEFHLETAPSLLASNWTQFQGPIIITNGNYSTQVPLTNSQMFFRLVWRP